ncbi:AraC family transcriptional regulator [Paenibacillus enshidis]|uniref:AraC family transcriptional regulator n=1 Tax=Paenibacillus enshidis TaxID=1458439 RepID=A0ABV5AT69_9BACL
MAVPTFLETGHMPEGFPIHVIHTGEQFSFAAHWHEEVEMVFVRGKRGRIGVYNQVYELEQGDGMIIRPGDVHYFLPGTEKLTIILFRMELISGSFIAEHDLLDTKKLFNKTAVMPACLSKEWEMKHCIDALSAEAKNRDAGYRWAMIARLYDLIVCLLRTKAPCAEAADHGLQAMPAKKFEFIEAVCSYLEQHYSESIKLEHIAEHIKFSKFYMCKLFKDIKGVTLMEYLNHLRIIKSEWALLFSESSILDIAIDHGFNNMNSYNRLFKKYNDCTPTEFRKKHKTMNAKYDG